MTKRLTNLEMVLVLSRLIVHYDKWMERRSENRTEEEIGRRKQEHRALKQAYVNYREAARNEEQQ